MSTFQKKFSFAVSLIISVVFLILFCIFLLFPAEKNYWLFILAFFIIAFLSTFIILNYSNENFIFSRVEKVFSSVVNYRNHKETRKHSGLGEDLIASLNEEINSWAEDRKNEAERLKKLELYRKEYIGNVSHELKTPIFNIQGYVLTLLDGGLEDPKVNREYLIRTDKSVERMINIIDDLESISQLETGELIIEQEKFDIVALAKDVCEGQEMKATARGIILSVKNDDPVYVFADRFRIRQVLTNLIVNSIKYGKEYGETIIQISENTDLIKIEISDNGIGIAEEHIDRLFERFYRVDKSRSREQGGTGLGLAIVKHILEAHEQKIHVTSQLGMGTTLSFTLKKVING